MNSCETPEPGTVGVAVERDLGAVRRPGRVERIPGYSGGQIFENGEAATIRPDLVDLGVRPVCFGDHLAENDPLTVGRPARRPVDEVEAGPVVQRPQVGRSRAVAVHHPEFGVARPGVADVGDSIVGGRDIRLAV